MDQSKRIEILKEMAIKVNEGSSLSYVIKMYNKKHPGKYPIDGLEATVNDFGIRLAKNPKEAIEYDTIVTCYVGEQDPTLGLNEIHDISSHYKTLLTRIRQLPKAERLKYNSWEELEKIRG